MTIVHPYHPQCGEQVQLLQVRGRGADPDMLVELPNGRHVVVAMSWTDYGRSGDDKSIHLSPPPLLDWAGLVQAAQFIKQIHREE